MGVEECGLLLLYAQISGGGDLAHEHTHITDLTLARNLIIQTAWSTLMFSSFYCKSIYAVLCQLYLHKKTAGLSHTRLELEYSMQYLHKSVRTTSLNASLE